MCGCADEKKYSICVIQNYAALLVVVCMIALKMTVFFKSFRQITEIYAKLGALTSTCQSRHLHPNTTRF